MSAVFPIPPNVTHLSHRLCWSIRWSTYAINPVNINLRDFSYAA